LQIEGVLIFLYSLFTSKKKINILIGFFKQSEDFSARWPTGDESNRTWSAVCYPWCQSI